MLALYHANLRPCWSRSSVTWKYNGVRFFIHPGELPNNLLPDEILRVAKRRCGIPVMETQSYAEALKSTPSPLPTKDQDAQTDPLPPTCSPNSTTKNLITSLQQDLAMAKQRIAAQSVQCCFWRNKFKATQQIPTPNPGGSAGELNDELVQVSVPDGPQLSIPKFAVDALHQPLSAVRTWYTQQLQEAHQLVRDQIAVSTKLQTMVQLLEGRVELLQKQAKPKSKK